MCLCQRNFFPLKPVKKSKTKGEKNKDDDREGIIDIALSAAKMKANHVAQRAVNYIRPGLRIKV